MTCGRRNLFLYSRHSLETWRAPLEFKTKLCDAHFQVLLPFFILPESLWAVQEISNLTSRSFTKPPLKHKEKRRRHHLCSFMILLCIFYVAGIELRRWNHSVIPGYMLEEQIFLVFTRLLYFLMLVSIFLDAEKLWVLQPACRIWCWASLLFSICGFNNLLCWVTPPLLQFCSSKGCQTLLQASLWPLETQLIVPLPPLHTFRPFPTYLIIYQHPLSKLMFPCPFRSSDWRKLNPSSVTSWFKWPSDLNDWVLWSVSVHLQSASLY